MEKSRMTAYDLALGALFVALMAVGANITYIVPFLTVFGVPLTLQTFFAILAGIILGSRLGAFSIIVYTILGLVGAPIFASFQGGPGIIFSPTFGFILSFTAIAFCAGKVAEMKRSLNIYIAAALVGTAVNYLIGVNLFYAAMNFWIEGGGINYAIAWSSMVPFLIKDVVLAVVAGVFAYRLEKSFLHRTPLRQAKAS
ncbi:biotin transporter BioY [Halobacillus litoralis]|uniref:biotin transporter BioY n=1 Tax=Halobacillus litoralis TaxID=45668 RepID=UPI001CD7AA1D|nr:biotin transporter BioY [Halobacillus litoralis]MCA0971173.1 biotin transporter BioY [Halobacillus litoralis]